MIAKRRGLIALACAGLALAAAAPPAEWTARAAATAQGTHLLGNPQARVRLVEFVSYTCPHCARFEQEADKPLRQGFVATGKASVEVRHFVRDPVDMTVTLLTDCVPPGKFFALHSAFLRSQEQWIGPLVTASAAQRARWTSGPFAGRTRAIARDFGFYAIMARHGYGARQVDACLADEARAKRLAAATEQAEELGVAGTPSFAIDGVVLAGTHDWDTLRPQLEARI